MAVTTMGGVRLSSTSGLTIHSSRRRFAARLNSGVRPCSPHRCSRGFGAMAYHAHSRRLLSLHRLARAVSGIGKQFLLHLGFGHTRPSARLDRPSRLRTGGSESSRPREPGLLVFGGSRITWSWPACCTVGVVFRLRGWAAAGRAQVPGSGGLTSRSSRCHIGAQTTWQTQLAMCFMPRCVPA